ncbi:MAG: TIGR02588 family protein [Pseudorhizobium sp.]
MTVSSKNKNVEASKPDWLEWTTGTVSALLVVGIIGWIAGQAILNEETPPEFRPEILSTQQVAGGFRVDFEIFNDGSTTAATVEVRGEIMEGGSPVGEAQVTFDYVPGKSSATGALLFVENPAGRDIRIRAIGYTEP